MRDIFSDTITRIRNGQARGLRAVSLFKPIPTFTYSFLELLLKYGYILGAEFQLKEKPKSPWLTEEALFVLLKYDQFQKPVITKIERISKPGCRVYIKSRDLWKLNNGKGIFVILTSRGMFADAKARKYNLGGEVLCYIE